MGMIIEEFKSLQNGIELILNMLKEKDKLYNKALEDLVKADRENIQLKKQIDLMAEVIYKRTNYKELNKYCNKKDKNNCERYTECYKCIKQYFERKSRE